MAAEILRLLLGLAIMALHRRIADHALRMEHLFAGVFGAGGMRYPAPFKKATAYTFYFCLGIAVCAIAMVRLFGMLGA